MMLAPYFGEWEYGIVASPQMVVKWVGHQCERDRIRFIAWAIILSASAGSSTARAMVSTVAAFLALFLILVLTLAT